jgi:hypothetical protein
LKEEIRGCTLSIHQHNRSLFNYDARKSSYVDRGKSELKLFLAQVLLFFQSTAQGDFLSLWYMYHGESLSGKKYEHRTG